MAWLHRLPPPRSVSLIIALTVNPLLSTISLRVDDTRGVVTQTPAIRCTQRSVSFINAFNEKLTGNVSLASQRNDTSRVETNDIIRNTVTIVLYCYLTQVYYLQ